MATDRSGGFDDAAHRRSVTLFRALDATWAFFDASSRSMTLDTARSGVQTASDLTITRSDLDQIVSIWPGAYELSACMIAKDGKLVSTVMITPMLLRPLKQELHQLKERLDFFTHKSRQFYSRV